MQRDTDNTLTQQDMIDKSYHRLTAKELVNILSDTTLTGKYFYNNSWYVFKVNAFKDGHIIGQNSVGTYDRGRWHVNKDDSMTTTWDGTWEDWTGIAYKVENEIMFFDSITKRWKTTYTLVENGTLSTEI